MSGGQTNRAEEGAPLQRGIQADGGGVIDMCEARDIVRRTTFKNALPKRASEREMALASRVAPRAARDISKTVEFYEQKLGFTA